MTDWPSFSSSASSALPAALQRQLAAGEQVLWQGRPRQGLMLRSSDAYLIPFSLLWCGFAIFWEWNVIRLDAPLLFKLLGIPFVLVGLYIVAGRFVTDARRRARTHYALTTERILIASGPNSKNIQSLSLRHLPDITLEEHANGTGTISLGNMHNAYSHQTTVWDAKPGMHASTPQLEGIANALHVFQLIRDAQRQHA